MAVSISLTVTAVVTVGTESNAGSTIDKRGGGNYYVDYRELSTQELQRLLDVCNSVTDSSPVAPIIRWYCENGNTPATLKTIEEEIGLNLYYSNINNFMKALGIPYRLIPVRDQRFKKNAGVAECRLCAIVPKEDYVEQSVVS